MSLSTFTPTDDDFNRDFDQWESELTGSGEDPTVPPFRKPARSTEKREAIAEALGFNRHRKIRREI